MIHHLIDRAISLIEVHQEYIDLIENIYNWDAEVNNGFSEDESEYNQNVIKKRGMDDDFSTYCREELKYHKHELERAKVRLRICMLTFNKGWTF